ncbi:MAG: cation-transporting P-type ATPase, partial [Actinomycetota bacterium]
AVIGAIFVTSDVSTASDAFDALMVAVSLAVAAVPEGLPAILTVVLALGVQRMAGHNAIVKRLLSVETLGAASVICTDKTGTLTRNEMTVVRVAVAGATADVSGVGYERDGVVRLPPDLPEPIAVSVAADVEELLRGGAAANDASLGEEWSRTADDAAHSGSGAAASSGDPTELALLVAAHKSTTTSTGSVRPAERLPVRVGELAFDSDRKLMSTLHEAEDDAVHGAPHVQFTKGAPDVVLTRCGAELDRGDAVPLTDDRRARIQATIDSFADDGLRTLAVARRAHLHGPSDFSTDHEHDLTLLGVVGIADPAKREVIPVIAEAHRAGVHTVMVTGDHPRTARAIGASLGLNTTDEAVVTGDDLASGALDDRIEHATVFARVAPEDKLRIVDAYQDAGRIVAMTGDGVNDAPALRHADIGVAMGRGGTEVARDAADMILADDDFRTIVRAIREGRELFADIRKFLRYLLASNTGEVLVMILGVLAASPLALDAAEEGLAVPLLATQILWINLLTDSALALALGVDPSVDDVMADRPRALDEPIIDRSMWVTIVLVGTTTAVAGLVALDLELAGGMLGGDGDLVTARTMLFTTVVLAQVFNAFNSRSDRVSAFRDPFANRLLWLAVVVTVVLQVAVVHVPTLNRAFDTTPLDLGRWLICFALASCVLIVDEIRKAIARVRRGPTVDVVM